MTNPKTPNKTNRVTFFQVTSDQMKRTRIVSVAHEYFEKKQPLLFKLPHKKALEYLDLLLWRLPQDSFLPHVIKDTPCQDLIVLTSSEENPNEARSIFNLTGEPILNPHFTTIYTFEDLSSTEKNTIAQKHYHAYKTHGYKIISL